MSMNRLRPLVTTLVICLALPVAAGAMREKSKGATNDVIDFVDDAVAEMAGSQALETSSPPERQLELRLTRFNANEGNKAVGSTYSAEVHFAFRRRS